MRAADSPTASDLAALARKYRALGELRDLRERAGEVASRETLIALAAEFPGALRELDTLARDAIDARSTALASAADGGPIEPWMTWMRAFHALYRAALFAKARPGEDPAKLASEASRHAGIEVDAAFLDAVAGPPRGRVGAQVLREIAARFGADESEVRHALLARAKTP